ncbi:5743_t:CDS:1, partial [Gigaspora margarita]
GDPTHNGYIGYTVYNHHIGPIDWRAYREYMGAIVNTEDRVDI